MRGIILCEIAKSVSICQLINCHHFHRRAGPRYSRTLPGFHQRTQKASSNAPKTVDGNSNHGVSDMQRIEMLTEAFLY